MKIMRVGEPGHEYTVVSLDGRSAYPVDGDILDGEVRDRARALLEADYDGAIDLSGIRHAAPLKTPGKIVCVGLNYRRHAAEAGMAIPEEPILFMKAPYTVHGPNDDVTIPLRSEKTDYEVELAVVIGTAARYLESPKDALAHVLGYMVADDVSERAFQLERGGQWDKGKNCETFSPLGPYLVTSDEVPDPQALELRLSVNGDVRQNSNTSDMIFPVDYLIYYISQFMALLPGDIILTGTPEGVGAGFEPPRFISEGDIVEVSIDGLGTQTHRLVNYTPAGATL